MDLSVVLGAFTCVVVVIATWAWLKLRGQAQALSHVPSVPRSSVLQGSRNVFFGNGVASQQLVLKTTRLFNFRPWVVPGGLTTAPCIVVTRPAAVAELLKRHTHKGYAAKALYYPGTPKTIVSSEGEDWAVRRKVLAPAFTAHNMRAAIPAVDQVAKQVVRQLSAAVPKTPHADNAGADADALPKSAAGVVIDVHSLTARYALDVIGNVLLGRTFGAVEDPHNPAHAAAHELSLISGQLYASPLRRYLRVGKARYDAALKALESVAHDVLGKHMSNEQPNDFFKLLETATYPNSSRLIWPLENRMESLRLVVNAAHDPAMPLSFALYELCRNPGLMAQAVAEADAVAPNPRWEAEVESPDLDAAAVRSLPFLGAVFLEALRKWPISGIGTARYLEKPDTVDGVDLPAGTFVIVPFFTMSRHEETWPKPETFNPWRYIVGGSYDEDTDVASDEEARVNVSNAMLAFSAGNRGCPGNHLATNEVVILLARLLRNFTFELANDEPVKLDCGIHLMPQKMELRVSRRPGTAN